MSAKKCKDCKGGLTLTCGEFIFAPCVIIEAELNEISEFSGEDCVTLHDVIPEIYNLIADLYIDDTFDTACLDIESEEPTHQEIEQAQTDAICEIKDTLDDLACLKTILDYPLEGEDCCECPPLGLDLACLEPDPCVNPDGIVTFKDLLQALIYKVCEGRCESKFIFVPIGTETKEIFEFEWEGCGVPQPVFFSDITKAAIQLTWRFDSIPNPTKLIIIFNEPTTFGIWVQLTF